MAMMAIAAIASHHITSAHAQSARDQDSSRYDDRYNQNDERSNRGSRRDRRGNFDDGYKAGYDTAYKTGYGKGYQDGRYKKRYNDKYVIPAPVATSGEDRSRKWNQRYSQTYTYQDDVYYRECRNATNAGPMEQLIGGLLGRTTSSRTSVRATTNNGVVIAGTQGAAMTNDLNCDDRGYAYNSYYDGFNSGRANSNWQWRNPNNNHRGEFRVGDYYNDADGFRCTTYTQQAYINSNRADETSGRACQQPDGTWVIVR